MARKLILGTYDTILNGPWTLSALELTAAKQRTQFVEVPGRDGELDLSTALTDGAPRYGNRTLTATLERSDGTRMEREDAINTMVNWLDGWRMDVRLPDDDTHYLTGRVHVEKLYSDMAHAAVSVTVICDPWRYNNHETVLTMAAGADVLPVRLPNTGRKTVVPLIQITGGTINLVAGSYSWALGAGTYQLPDLIVPQGGLDITYSGSGELRVSYREAVL